VSTERGRELPEDLWRVAEGEAGLYEAFHTLSLVQDDQARSAADLHERETWAATLLIGASAAIWSNVPSPTLRFVISTPPDAEQCHVELGRFGHLAALSAPSVQEQELAACATPSFALVYAHQERRSAGCTGALGYSYVPITIADAVSLLGFSRVLTQIEAATRMAGKALLSVAESQGGRHSKLVQVERMFNWAPVPAAAGDVVARGRTNLVLALMGQTDRQWLMPVAASLGIMAGLTYVLAGVGYALLALFVIVVGLAVWRMTSSPGA
jgi:hypothetical protein